jgi:hypothetical protein
MSKPEIRLGCCPTGLCIDEEAIVAKERERAASIAEDLATRWEGSAKKIRQQRQTRFFFIGPSYTTPRAESDAKTIEAAAYGLRTVARLIRDGV